MSLEKDITLIKSMVESGNPVFKAASQEEVAKRSPKDFKIRIEPAPGEDYNIITVSNFRLPLGNNYRSDHFFRALIEEYPEIIDELRAYSANDSVRFDYRGSYGAHEDNFSMLDIYDYVRAHYDDVRANEEL